MVQELQIGRTSPPLLGGEGVPEGMADKEDFWKARYHSIVNLEKHLHRDNTRIIKFYLHLSKEEQRRRFLARIDEPEKNWKFSEADAVERKYWDQYMEAYEHCLSATSTKTAPWHVVPADDKLNARLIISRVVIEALKELKMSYPEITPSKRRELLGIRKHLTK